ncbi:MAG: DEAD/DEAH box helicase [Fuerstiella sp.]|nr:DEAD/DEAH box helicase [Fuerstiella sp.]MCP4858847.1 DEAD/DEAH box helicase [Fuerstiella sp.]
MTYQPDNPLIVQGDQTVLVEVDSPHYVEARDYLAGFAELIKSPEHIHTYRITPLSIWNAAAAGTKASAIVETLERFSKYEVPQHVVVGIRDYASRYGRLQLTRADDHLVLTADDQPLAEEICRQKAVGPLLEERLSDVEFRVSAAVRGKLKQALLKVGFPIEDLAGYRQGESLGIVVRQQSLSGDEFQLRDYQQAAADVFYASGAARGGSGVIVLPCGAGKTIVGLACMAKLQTSTLILTTNVTATRQWVREVLDKTMLAEDQVGEYNGSRKDVLPVTVATYNIMTWRENKDAPFKHLKLFDERDWGLIIYDEVHLLPAPVFQVTAGLQARRRLGLTATLVREDGREDDVFALIGPKKVDVPWKVLEKDGWIATASCTEIRLPLPKKLRMPYAVADRRAKFRVASENPAKLNVVRQLLNQHPDEPTLIIGMYVRQIDQIASDLGIPVITGSVSQKTRDRLFGDFTAGRLRVLAVSKVANFAVDLPDASVAIQISGTFGSRQEEAQRLGRILRPKTGLNRASFYTIVSRDTVEQEFAVKRQLFLCEQGYTYNIQDGC